MVTWTTASSSSSPFAVIREECHRLPPGLAGADYGQEKGDRDDRYLLPDATPQRGGADEEDGDLDADALRVKAPGLAMRLSSAERLLAETAKTRRSSQEPRHAASTTGCESR